MVETWKCTVCTHNKKWSKESDLFPKLLSSDSIGVDKDLISHASLHTTECWQDHSGPRGHVTAAEEMKDVTGTVELAAENNKRDVTIQPCYTTHPMLFRKSRGRADEVGGRKEERR